MKEKPVNMHTMQMKDAFDQSEMNLLNGLVRKQNQKFLINIVGGTKHYHHLNRANKDHGVITGRGGDLEVDQKELDVHGINILYFQTKCYKSITFGITLTN